MLAPHVLMSTKLPQKTYETICLTKVDMPDDKYQAMIDRCTETIQKVGEGELLINDDWGRAKISYPIEKDSRARWTYIRYRSNAAGIDEINRTLKLNEFVLRANTYRTDAEGSDYNSLRNTIAGDIAERENMREKFRERKMAERGNRGDRRPRRDRANEAGISRGPRGEGDGGSAPEGVQS